MYGPYWCILVRFSCVSWTSIRSWCISWFLVLLDHTITELHKRTFINRMLLIECYSEIVTSLSLTVLIIVFFCSIFVLVLLHCLFHVFVVLFLFLYFSIIISAFVVIVYYIIKWKKWKSLLFSQSVVCAHPVGRIVGQLSYRPTVCPTTVPNW